MDVTEKRLAAALEGVYVIIGDDGDEASGRLRHPGEVAALLWQRMGVLPQPDDEYRATPVGADPELTAMAALLPALPLVSALGYDARERVMDWAARRATDGLPPF